MRLYKNDSSVIENFRSTKVFILVFGDSASMWKALLIEKRNPTDYIAKCKVTRFYFFIKNRLNSYAESDGSRIQMSR